jgi:probable F420-dependent oxidoreductase
LATQPDGEGFSERLGAVGVWFGTTKMSAGQAAEFAMKVESLGYSALWLPEATNRDPFAHIAYLASQTKTLIFATGIANIFNRHAGVMKQAALTIAEQSGGRFILGLGVSHEPMVAGVRNLDYSRPLARMRGYLADMDSAPYSGPEVEPPPRLLAALGPKMLELASRQADGAHPYWTTPAHTEQARAILGPDKLLCVEQKVALTTSPSDARAWARDALAIYVDLPNYRNNWLRLGYTEDDIRHGSPAFLDSVVAWGSADAIRRRVQAHYDAGATHVCIQPITAGGFGELDDHALEELAPG